MEQGWLPADGIAPFLSGTPPILSLAAVEVGASMLAVDAGMDRVRAKGKALTEFAVELFDEEGCRLGTFTPLDKKSLYRDVEIPFTEEELRRFEEEEGGHTLAEILADLEKQS